MVLYDCQYNAEHDWRGMVYLNTPDAAWNHEGDLVLSNAIHVVCQADDCLPVGPQTGDIVFTWVNRALPVPLLDLNGHSVAVNAFDTARGGIVTNSAVAIATLRIGEDGESGAVALPALSGGNIALAKRGTETNTVSLASSDLAALRVESGTLVLTGASADVLSAASVEVAEGATLVLDGVTLCAGKLTEQGEIERRNGGAVDVAATPNTWFSADAATGVVSGGAWVSGDAAFGRVGGLARPEAAPPVVDGAWIIAGDAPARFAANEGRRDFPRVEAMVRQGGAWPADMLGDLLAEAAARGARGRLLAVEEADGATLSWRGLVAEGGAPAWRTLLGVPVATGAVCRVAAEFDFSGSAPRVSYLAKGTGSPGDPLTRLRDAAGECWFPAPGAATPFLAGRVEIAGSGDLFAIAGTAATDAPPPPPPPVTVFILQ